MEHWILYTVFHIHAFQLHCWSRSRLKLQSFTIQWWSNCSLLDADKVPFTMANKFMCRIRKNCHKHWWMLNLEQVAMKRNWILCLRISGKSYQRRTGKLIEIERKEELIEFFFGWICKKNSDFCFKSIESIQNSVAAFNCVLSFLKNP